MKQYWRISTIRTLSGLVLGMLVIGQLYYEYIPPLVELGIIGALILSAILIVFFMGLGWYYDVKAKMWMASSQAYIERDPFQYVPGPNSYASEYPIHYAFLSTIQTIFQKIGLDDSSIKDILEYLGDYYNLRPVRKDILTAPKVAEQYLDSHSFSSEEPTEPKKVRLRARLKLGFEVQRIRLIWVQQLTGMATDALVFGALYVTLLFPNEVVNDIVPLNILIIGLLVLSLPLFFGITAIGWYYDKRLRVWSADSAVRAERSPYQYVPPPKAYGIEMPIYFTLFETLIEVFKQINVDTSELENVLKYLTDYGCLDVRIDRDIAGARTLRKQYGRLFDKTERS
jgi:hypothetical protein